MLQSIKTCTVLFVDDEPNILHSLKRSLHGESFNILLAGGGDEALDLMQRERVDIIVTEKQTYRSPKSSF